MSIFRKKWNVFHNEKIRENFKKHNLSVNYNEDLKKYTISSMDKHGKSYDLIDVDSEGKLKGRDIKLDDANSIFYDYVNTVQHINNNNGFLKRDFGVREQTTVDFYGYGFALMSRREHINIQNSVFQGDDDNIRNYDLYINSVYGTSNYKLKLPLSVDKNSDVTVIDKVEMSLNSMDKEIWLLNQKKFEEAEAEKAKVVLDKPFVQEKFKEYNIDCEYNKVTGNYDLYSRKLDYKDEKYKIISCDKKGKVDGHDLYLQDDDSDFYNYVENLQTLKSDVKYKNWNFEFNAERVAKIRELTKPIDAEVENNTYLLEKQARFEKVISKLTNQLSENKENFEQEL